MSTARRCGCDPRASRSCAWTSSIGVVWCGRPCIRRRRRPFSTRMMSGLEADDLPGVAGDADLMAALLAAGLPAGEPSATLRERVLRASVPLPLVFLGRFQGIWLPSADAPVAAKELYRDSGDRLSSRLVRLAEGESLLPPVLPGWRSVFVVKGRLSSGALSVEEGDAFEMGSAAEDWRAAQQTLVLDLETAGATAACTVVQLARNAEWIAQGDGVRIRMVFPPHEGRHLFVLDAIANATLIEHQHTDIEELLVLRGRCEVEGREMFEGDYHRATAGTTHGETRTGEDGCLLVCSRRQPV